MGYPLKYGRTLLGSNYIGMAYPWKYGSVEFYRVPFRFVWVAK